MNRTYLPPYAIPVPSPATVNIHWSSYSTDVTLSVTVEQRAFLLPHPVSSGTIPVRAQRECILRIPRLAIDTTTISRIGSVAVAMFMTRSGKRELCFNAWV